MLSERAALQETREVAEVRGRVWGSPTAAEGVWVTLPQSETNPLPEGMWGGWG